MGRPPTAVLHPTERDATGSIQCFDSYLAVHYSVDVDENWTTQLRKGVLELCILNIIGAGRIYGYDIVRQLRLIDALVVSEGTIYPILSRLKRDGLVRTTLEESPSGPARKYYELTRRGEQLLTDMNRYWETLTREISDLRKANR
jgi:PadR family transcriptional regulator PadR